MRLAWRRQAPGRLDPELLWGSLGLTLAAGAVVAARVPLPGLSCPFHALTGWPCGTCGATRATLALGDGAFAQALAWNPLIALIGVAWAAWSCWALVSVALRLPRLRLELSRPWEPAAVRLAAVGAFAANWAFLVVAGC